MMNTLWLSIVRTLVPAIVGSVMTWLATTGLEIDPGFQPALESVLFAGFTGVYYIGARLLERYVSPRFGWLLGAAQSPDSYSPGPAPVEEPSPVRSRSISELGR